VGLDPYNSETTREHYFIKDLRAGTLRRMASSQRIYLDYAATTPVDPAVLRAMRPYFSEKFGNAGSLHSFGQEAVAALDHARETIARSVGADFREIIFTGSATEANNLAIRGALKISKIKKPKIIVSAVEHESVLQTVRDLECSGAAEAVYLPVDARGVISVKKLKETLDDRTALVSVMYANNEIGAVQPIAEIAEIIQDFKKNKTTPFFHTDASQAFQFLSCAVSELGIDLMTLSSHKIYGPKGVGALYAATKDTIGTDGHWLNPIIMGGGQEFGLRSGTENIPAIAGFSRAVELADALREKETKRIRSLSEHLWRGIKKIYPKAELNGASDRGEKRGTVMLPHILSIHFPGRKAEDLITKFDLLGLAVSAGSACRARAVTSSYVIEALGHSAARAKSSVRFSLGRPTTKAEIARALRIIKMSA
jgi:cysteine desulfurase